jgi:hypothetical protein
MQYIFALPIHYQCCQMVYFQTKNPNFVGSSCNGICRYFVYFTVKSYILSSFGAFCGQLVHFSGFGMLQREKSGNPVHYLS